MEYTITYSPRRKSIRITIERDRTVVVSAPEGTSAELIDQAVRHQRLKIQQWVNHPQKYPNPRPISEFVTGESLLFLGRTYPLTVVNEPIEGVRFDDHFCIGQHNQRQANALLKQWYQQQARDWLTPKIAQYAKRLSTLR